MSVAEDLLGTEVGRYRLERLLGEGGMGRVYLGVDVERGARVAIKVLSKQTPELVQRFFAEARAVSLISHFNIVNLVDLSELPDGRPYMVMELVEGQSLRDAAPTASISEIARIVCEVLAALEAAHAIGIVHRDLKPDNIMVTRGGHAKVLDFGVAKLAPGVGGGLTPRTKEGLTMGTPAYMAPEQVTGSPVDARTDVYTMGVVLFEAVTGQRPFSGGTDFDVMRAHRDRPPPHPRTLAPELPVTVEAVILRALAKNPAKRFQSAHAMATALADAVAGRTSADPIEPVTVRGRKSSAVAAEPAEPAEPTAAPPSRVPAMLAVAAIAIAATVVFVIARHRRNAHHVVDDVPADAAEVTIDARVEIAVDAPPIAPPVDAIADAPVDAGAVDAVVITRLDTRFDPARLDNIIESHRLPAPITRAADFASDAFDPLVYLGRATELARQLAPDAQLTQLVAEPVSMTNVVDLGSVRHRVEYTYISRAGAKITAYGGTHPCLVVVSIASAGATARVVPDKHCTQKPVLAPRCTLADLRAKMNRIYITDHPRPFDLNVIYRGAWVLRGFAGSRGDDEVTRTEMPDC